MTAIPPLKGALPKKIHLHKKSKTLEIGYADNSFTLSAEYLRVHSPSAEVKGHGKPVLQIGKQHVGIQQIESVGTYAIRIHFDDGHNTGLYTWDYLFELCHNQDRIWQEYLDALVAAGKFRDPDTKEVTLR